MISSAGSGTPRPRLGHMNSSTLIEKRFVLQLNIYAIPIPFIASALYVGLAPGLPFVRAPPGTYHGEPSSGL